MDAAPLGAAAAANAASSSAVSAGAGAPAGSGPGATPGENGPAAAGGKPTHAELRSVYGNYTTEEATEARRASRPTAQGVERRLDGLRNALDRVGFGKVGAHLLAPPKLQPAVEERGRKRKRSEK